MNKKKEVNVNVPYAGFGDWLKKNLGTVGSVLGGVAGTIIAPGVGTSIGASLGGSLGKLGQGKQDGIEIPPYKPLPVPAGYPTKGLDVNSLYANGGIIDNVKQFGKDLVHDMNPVNFYNSVMDTINGEDKLNKTASNMYKVNGESHSGPDGGVPITVNGQKTDALVEGGETLEELGDGVMVYSKRLGVDNNSMKALKDLKLDGNFKNYAEAANWLGVKKKLFEDKLGEGSIQSKNTAQLMLDRIEKGLDILRQGQYATSERLKRANEGELSYGKDDSLFDMFSKDRERLLYENRPNEEYQMFGYENEEEMKKYPNPLDIPRNKEKYQGIKDNIMKNGGKVDKYSVGGLLGSAANSIFSSLGSNKDQVSVDNGYNALPDYLSLGAQFLGNAATASNIQDRLPRTTLPAQPYVKTTPNSTAINAAKEAAAAAREGAQYSGAGNRGALNAAILAKELNATNQIATQDALREDQNRQQHIQRESLRNYGQAQMDNQLNLNNLNLANNKLANTHNVYRGLFEGLSNVSGKKQLIDRDKYLLEELYPRIYKDIYGLGKIPSFG